MPMHQDPLLVVLISSRFCINTMPCVIITWIIKLRLRMTIKIRHLWHQNGHTVYPKKYAHGFCFAVLCCGYTLTVFSHIHLAYFTSTVAIWRLPQCQQSNPDEWINTSFEFMMNDYITTTKQSTTKPCAYFLGYTVVQYGWITWRKIMIKRPLGLVWSRFKEYLCRCQKSASWRRMGGY